MIQSAYYDENATEFSELKINALSNLFSTLESRIEKNKSGKLYDVLLT